MIKKVAGEKWREALHDFYPVYEEMHQSCPAPYEGIRELIETLQKAGVLVALITGKGDKSCRITLEQFGMRDLFCLSAAWATTADVGGLEKANSSKVFPSIKELTLFLSIEK